MREVTLGQFYVYVIYRPNGVPCYVGKGSRDRWKRRDRHKENPHLANIFAQAGGKLRIEKVHENLTEQEAFDYELLLINQYGREIDGGVLTNVTLGGGGTVGAKMTADWRRNRSEKAKALWADPEYRAKMTAKKIGNQNSKKPHTLSDEWRAKLTENMKGNTFTLGMKLPQLSENMKRVWADPEYKNRMIQARFAGGQYSSEACKARWEIRRKNAGGFNG